MSADAIAKVVSDLRAGRVKQLQPLPVSFDGPVVDATAIYHSLVARDEPIMIYEDHPCIAPPWEDALICYANEHGNVIVMLATTTTPDHPDLSGDWETADEVDWNLVRWRLHTYLFLGGRSKTLGAIITGGPVHMWQFAIYESGEPADLHWVQLSDTYPMSHWDMAHLVLLGALNFMNCRNVELVEPRRPRAEARRIARTGVTVSTINVFPVGRSTRSDRASESTGVPLTSVRGHFARYGPEYGRGLLFGKYAGRYWVPQYARGSAEHGESEHNYNLRAETTK